MDWLQIIVELLQSLVYLLFRCLFGLVQELWWLLNGTYFARRTGRKPEGYAKSAHVLDIWWKGKMSALIMPNSVLDFATVHNRFDHPTVVLQDNVTIYAITSSYAMFVETDPEIDVTNTDFSSFMKVAQFVHAKRVIILPIAAFHRLADQLGDPKGELLYMANIGRCGSTLLCRIYEETGKCVVFTEPDVITNLSMHHSSMGAEHFKKVATSAVRVLCKPRAENPDVYVIKVCGPAMVAGLLPLHSIYPEAKMLFMYRDTVKAAQSFTKVREEDPLFKLLDAIIKHIPSLQDLGLMACGFSPEGFMRARYPLSKYFMLLVVMCAKYKELRRDGLPIFAVLYEDMLEDPEYATRTILRYSGLDEALVSKSLRAYGRDTHKDENSPFSQQRVNRHKPDEVTPSVRAELDAICAKMGIPKTTEPFMLENTITSQNNKLKHTVIAKNGHIKNGHTMNGHAMNGGAMNGHAMNGDSGGAMNGHVMNGGAMNSHVMNGRAMTCRAMNGHAINGHVMNGRVANGHAY